MTSSLTGTAELEGLTAVVVVELGRTFQIFEVFDEKNLVKIAKIMYRSGSQNGSCREMGHSAPTWAMHGKRQNSMHGPAGLTQIEKKCASLFSNGNFKLKLA